MGPDSTLTTENSTHPLDHSSGLSKAMGQIFDNGDACDIVILVHSSNGNASEMDTICAHKMILSPFQAFNVSEESKIITINISRPCLEHFHTFIRYQEICVAGIKEGVEKTL